MWAKKCSTISILYGKVVGLLSGVNIKKEVKAQAEIQMLGNSGNNIVSCGNILNRKALKSLINKASRISCLL